MKRPQNVLISFAKSAYNEREICLPRHTLAEITARQKPKIRVKLRIQRVSVYLHLLEYQAFEELYALLVYQHTQSGMSKIEKQYTSPYQNFGCSPPRRPLSFICRTRRRQENAQASLWNCRQGWSPAIRTWTMENVPHKVVGSPRLPACLP